MGKWPQAALAAGSVLLADQLSKWVVLVWLTPVRRVEVIPGFFDLNFAMNTGVAFGLMSGLHGPWRVVGLSAVAFVAVLVIFFFVLSVRPGERLFLWGLTLVSGGAVANVIDRLRLG
ncbi:MAG: signal peptidase II, partial [Pseudomonadota bacterium]